MANWKNININLGEVKENVSKLIIFESTEDLEKIINMTSSCGCSTPTLDGKRKIIVKFNTGTIPIHLHSIGFYVKNLKITVTYENQKSDILKFTVKIIK